LIKLRKEINVNKLCRHEKKKNNSHLRETLSYSFVFFSSKSWPQDQQDIYEYTQSSQHYQRKRFYAGVKKKPGPKRKQLAESLRAAPRRVEYPHRAYKVSYKLRVLSYWVTPSIGTGPTQLRKPTRGETATRFGVPEANLSRWKKEEREGKFPGLTLEQYRVAGGGRRRKWEVLE